MAIVGAGFTGLWTALYLARADPSLRIAVLEAETAGLRRERPQRRLGSALFPSSLASAGQALQPGRAPWRCTPRCGTASTR